MPPSYWAEAKHTTVYLIYRLSSKLLQYKSPYELLFHKEHNYSFLKPFGCACFPYLRPYNNNKLQFRSSKCVLLGYSLNPQGYRCLDLVSNHVFLSRHVLFDEVSFLFNKAHAATTPDHSPSSDLPVILSGPSLSSCSPCLPVSYSLPSLPSLVPKLGSGE